MTRAGPVAPRPQERDRRRPPARRPTQTRLCVTPSARAGALGGAGMAIQAKRSASGATSSGRGTSHRAAAAVTTGRKSRNGASVVGWTNAPSLAPWFGTSPVGPSITARNSSDRGAQAVDGLRAQLATDRAKRALGEHALLDGEARVDERVLDVPAVRSRTAPGPGAPAGRARRRARRRPQGARP